ncbi:hypothetical protein [Olsenella sp. Marseille-P4559]|uniref:hypothetical protein n=1 Tax=Olsenella sp. Marseille-P4559 TaxID=2364795 RepID=UPI001030E98A|nr:hypothetical protein [Olsenella sp. Marseille-P4559]
MDLRILDSEVSDNVKRVMQSAAALVEIGEQYNAILRALAVEGIASERFASAVESVIPIVSGAGAALGESVSQLAPRANDLIANLDEDDALLD